MHTNQSLHQIDQQYYLPAFNRFPVAFARGEGCYLWDVEGKRYLDALAGIAVNTLGHGHPKVVQAIQEQAAQLMHISNFFVSEPQMQLAEKLSKLSGMDRVFFTNSGAESLEGAFKIARKYAHSQGRGGHIISFENSFHGRTLATLATGIKSSHKGFEPIPVGFRQVPFNDMDAVKAATDKQTAAIVIEAVQGEGGIHLAEQAFLQALRAFCDKHHIVLIFDEVQSGIGRTGYWFAKDYFGVQPDIMTLAKGLGGGVPIGAILSSEKVSAALNFGDHGTTFGGNPLVCAASLATLQAIEDENLLEKVRQNGTWLREELQKLNEPSIKQIRGLGLMTGVEFDFETKALVLEMLKNGVVANATATKVLRLVPPLIITKKELSVILEVLQKSIQHIQKHEK